MTERYAIEDDLIGHGIQVLHLHWMTLPECGHIAIFNRSHSEEVVTPRVNPDLLAGRKPPPRPVDNAFPVGWRAVGALIA